MNDGSAGAGVVILLIGLALYFVPWIVAARRHHHQSGMVAVINIFLGWTLIGWVAALAIACSHTDGGRPASSGWREEKLDPFRRTSR